MDDITLLAIVEKLIGKDVHSGSWIWERLKQKGYKMNLARFYFLMSQLENKKLMIRRVLEESDGVSCTYFKLP